MDQLFYGHMLPEAVEYRHRYTVVWAGHPQFELELCADLTLPPPQARQLVDQQLKGWGQEDPPLVDVICTTLEKGEHSVMLLWPPWSGKTIIAATTLGLQLPKISRKDPKGLLELEPIRLDSQPTPYRLFNSDVAWIMPHQGELSLLRPEGELPIWLWDLARTITRKALGRKKFENDRKLHPQNPERRAQFAIFRRLDPQPLKSLLTERWCCHPDVLVFLERRSGAAEGPELEELEGRGWEELVGKALKEASVFSGKFWARDKEKVERRIGALLKALGGSDRPRLARVVVGRGGLPTRKVALLIKQLLEEA
jgi:hypothetical protein